MHRALAAPIILHEVFTYLTVDDDPDNFVDRRTLESAATCCQIFSNALDVLWRVMGSIEPLFSVLPTFQKKTRAINGSITTDDWSRFQQYARRIRILCLKGSKINNFNFILIAQLLKGEPLLPCLGVLDHKFDTWESLLIAPTLYNLTLTTSDSPEECDLLGAFLHALTAATPKLCHLDLTAGAFSPSHMQMIARSASLRTFSLVLQAPDVHIVHEIATLRNVTKLILDFGSQKQRLPNGAKGLDCLCHLRIRAHLTLVADFIDLVSSNDLKFLHITHAWHQKSKAAELECMGKFWDYILRHASRWSNSLQNLELFDYSPNSLPSTQTAKPPFALLDQILPFKMLQRLSVDFKFINLQVRDDDVQTMANSWPVMQILQIFDAISPSRLSYAALETVSLHWPSIQYIAVPLDLSILPPKPRYIKSHPLKTLNLRSVTVKDPMLVARSLDSLFPSLEFDYTDADKELWKQVGSILGAFQSVRKDELMRLQG